MSSMTSLLFNKLHDELMELHHEQQSDIQWKIFFLLSELKTVASKAADPPNLQRAGQS